MALASAVTVRLVLVWPTLNLPTMQKSMGRSRCWKAAVGYSVGMTLASAVCVGSVYLGLHKVRVSHGEILDTENASWPASRHDFRQPNAFMFLRTKFHTTPNALSLFMLTCLVCSFVSFALFNY
jgi:hypothetical protein